MANESILEVNLESDQILSGGLMDLVEQGSREIDSGKVAVYVFKSRDNEDRMHSVERIIQEMSSKGYTLHLGRGVYDPNVRAGKIQHDNHHYLMLKGGGNVHPQEVNMVRAYRE